MKKNYVPILLFSVLLFVSNITNAQSGIFESYVIINNNGSGNQFYDLNPHTLTVNPDFDGANLGVFMPSNTLVLNGAQNKTYKCGLDDIINGWLNYRIYLTTDSPPGFISTEIFHFNDDGTTLFCGTMSFDQTWQSNAAGINILNGLGSGDYYLEVFTHADFTYTTGSGTHYVNNDPDGGGPTPPNNYKATFRIDNPPIAICQDITVQLDASGNATIVAADIDDGSSDDFDNPPTLSININSFDCSDVGSPVTVTLTAEDSLNQTDTCTATVTIQDTILPTFTCPSDATVNLDGSCQILIPDLVTGIADEADNCGTANVSQSPTAGTAIASGDGTTHTVTISVDDGNGNIATCDVTLTGNDNTLPTFTCPSDASLNLNGTCQIVIPDLITGIVDEADNCGTANVSQSPTAGTAIASGDGTTHTVTISVDDGNGNIATCDVTLTGNDNTLPTFTCPSDASLNLNGTCQIVIPDLVTVIADEADNCGTTIVTQSPTAGTAIASGDGTTHTVTISVDDGNGNIATCDVTLTGNDNTLPTFTCPSDASLNLNGTCQIVIPDLVTVIADEADNCGTTIVTQSPTAGTAIASGDGTTHTVTISVDDGNGNIATCDVTLTGNDNTLPTFTCPSDASVNLNGTCQIVIPDLVTGIVDEADNCGTAIVTQSPTAGTAIASGDGTTHTVTISVDDVNGNIATCNVTLTSNDVTAPTAICRNITIQLDSVTGLASITPAQIDDGSSDNCGTSNLSLNITDFDCSDIGVNNVTLTVDDGNGNSSGCNATVTVQDITPPVAVCQNITIQLDASGNATIAEDAVNNGSTDACGGLTFDTDITSFDCTNIGANSVVLTVTDANGNTDTCNATVTITDASASASVSILSDPSDPDNICDSAPVTFTATPSGTYGTPIYQWQVNGIDVSGETNSTFTTSTLVNADTVTVIMTSNLFSCGIVSNPITVTVNSTVTPSVTIQADATSICPGESVIFSEDLIINGGLTPSYDWWLNGVSTGITSSTYTITPNDGDSIELVITPSPEVQCPSPATATSPPIVISVNPLPSVDAGSNQTICLGDSVTLSGSGATSYTWDNGVTDGVPFSPGATTVYTVTGTDSNGCQNTDTVTVTVNPLPSVDAGSNQTICLGDSVTLSGSGATSYTWDNGVTDGVPFSPGATQVYTVTGTDSNGCQNTDTVTVTVNPLPSVDAGSNQTICLGDSVTLSGSGATSYTWDNGVTDGVPFSPGATTVYTVTGTDSNGCQNTDTVTVTVNPLPSVDAGSNQTICLGDSVTLSGSGATSYTWDNGVTDGVPFSPGATTVYTVTGTDSNGCQNTDTVTVTVNPLPSVDAGSNQTICLGDSVTLSGSGATSYTWDNGVTDGVPFSPGATQVYTVTGTDSNGCQNTDTVTVTVNPLPSVDAGSNQTICLGDSVTLSGSGATSYTWDNGVTDGVPFSPGATTVYTVTGTDSNGCQNTDTVTVTVNPLPSVDAGSNQTICLGDSVTLSGSGATSYTWDNGVTDGVPFSPGATQVYTVTGTDSNGCQNTDTVTVTVNPLPSVDAGSNQTICLGDSVTLSGSGATSYTWDNGVTDGVPFSPGATTVYTVTGTDSNGCQNTDTVTVTVNPNLTPSVSIAASLTAICTGNSVTFTATPTNGGSSPSYQWQVNGGNVGSNSPTYITSGLNNNDNITVILTSSETCITSATATSNTITMSVYSSPPATPGAISGDSAICPVITGGIYSVVPVANAVSYNWSLPSGFTITAGGVTNSITVNVSALAVNGNITVTAVNPCGASSSSSLPVTVGTFAAANAGPDQTVCSGTSQITLAGTVGGVIDRHQDWDWTSNGAGGSFSNGGNNLTGTYSFPGGFSPTSNYGEGPGRIKITIYTIDPAGSCEAAIDDMFITMLPNPTASISGSTTFCEGNNANITFTATPNTIITYNINGGSPQTINIDGSGTAILNSGALTSTRTYNLVSVAYSSSPACSRSVSGSATITVHQLTTVEAGGPNTVCQSSSPSAITLTGASVGGGATQGAWSITSGGGTLSSTAFTANPQNVTYSPATNFVGTVTLTLTTNAPGTCPANSDTRIINVDLAPTVDAGSPQTVCADSFITLAGTRGGSATSSIWSAPSGSFSNVNSLTSTYTPSISSGTVTLTLTTNDPSGPCNAVSDTVVITVDQIATVDAGSPQTVCADSFITLAGTRGGSATSSTWSAPSGSFSNVNSLTSTYTPSISSGTVTLTLTTNDPSGPCNAVSDTVVITVDQIATVDAGSPQTICADSFITLAGTRGGSATSSTWSAPSGSFSNTSSLTSTYTPSISSGTVTLTLTTNDPTGPCNAVSDTVVITVDQVATVDAGAAQTVCADGSSIILAGTRGGSATSSTWSAPSGSFSNVNSLTSTYTPSISSGTVTLTLTTNDPAGPCNAVSDTVVITVDQIATVDAGSPQTVCADSFITLAGTRGGSATSSTWSAPSGSFSNVNSLTSTYTPSISSGTVTLTLTTNDPAGLCNAVSDTVVITVDQIATVDAGSPQTVCAGNSINLNGTIGGSATSSTWSAPSGSFSNVNSLTSTYTPSISTGTVTLTLTTNNPNGPCNAVSDTVIITVKDDIIITTQPQNIGVCVSQPASLSVVAVGDDRTYQWYHNGSPVSNTANISGATSNVLSFNMATLGDAGTYYVIVSGNASCPSVQSNSVTLNVNQVITITTQPVSQTLCEGSNVTFTVAATGSIAGYQWRKNGVNIPGATGPAYTSYTINNLTSADAGNYDVVISSPGGTCSQVYSAIANLTVDLITTVEAGGPDFVCQSSSPSAITLSGASIGGGATTGAWSITSGGGTLSSTVQTANPQNVTYTPASGYTGIVTLTLLTNSPGTCPANSDTRTINVDLAPTVIAGGPDDICQSSSPIPYVLSGASLGGSAATGAWSVTSGGGTLSSTAQTANPETITYTPAVNFTGTVILTLTTNDPSGPCLAVSATRTLNISNVATVSAGSDQIICSSSNAVMSGSFGGSATSASWSTSGTGSFDNINNANAEYTPSPADILAGSVTLTYTTDDPSGPCPAVSDDVVITINPDLSDALVDGFANDQQNPPQPGPISSQIIACHQGDGTLTLQIDPSYAPYVVRWEYLVTGGTWQTVPGGNAGSLTYDFTGLIGITAYRVIINSGVGCGEVISASAYVSVIPADLKPEPVTATPTAFCLGQSSLFETSTNYGAELLNSGGLFQTGQINTQDPNSWLIDENVRGLSASGNNVKENNWSGTNPKDFTVGGTSYSFNSGDPKFAIASGNQNKNQQNDPLYSEGGILMTTLATPIFSLMTLQDATFTFDEAFVLTGPSTCLDDNMVSVNYPAGQAIIQISTDGGATYNTIPDSEVLDNPYRTGGIVTGPANSGNLNNFQVNTTTLDLSAYFGQTQMRIRFVLIRNCESVWALDNMGLPGGAPVSSVIWEDQFEVVISTNNTATVTPVTPGYQRYRVTTFINGCRSLAPDGSEDVYLTVDLAYATAKLKGNACGDGIQLYAYDNNKTPYTNYLELDLAGLWVPGTYTVPPDLSFDYAATGATGEWSIAAGPQGPNPPNYADLFYPSVNDPRAEFLGPTGQYTLTWTVHGIGGDCTANVVVDVNACATLDFDGRDDNVTFRNDFDLDSSPFSIEVWVKPNAQKHFDNGSPAGPNDPIQTILSKRDATDLTHGYDLRLTSNNNIISFNWNNGNTLASPFAVSANRWYHVAVTFSGGTYRLYIDGIEMANSGGGNAAPLNNNFECIMGAMDQAAGGGNPDPLNYFSGWLDELRIWNVALSPEQIRHMMNQEIEASGANVLGRIVPINIPGLTWANLDGYYRMNQAQGDIAGGYVLANAGTRNGQMRKIVTWQEETAPLPYDTDSPGNWYDKTATTPWLYGDSVWDYPNAIGVDGSTRIDWNIVRTSHNIDSDLTSASPRNVTVLGLLVNPASELTITAMGTQDENNSGHGLWVTHYLRLDGQIDLIGESQLVQKRYTPIQVNESMLDVMSSGYLERDQQGTTNLHNYNYWGAPVGPQIIGTNNNPYGINSILRDGTDTNNPQVIQWTNSYDADPSTIPITLSRRWIWAYENYVQNTYANWSYKAETGTLAAGLSFIMKGSGVGDPITDVQNYVLTGKPNNATISNPINTNSDALVGNPYSSAIDADQFILDNIPGGNPGTSGSIEGALYFWEHYFSNNTHILRDYEGGYAVYSLSGGIAAVTPPITSDGYTIVGGNGVIVPGQYIPVGQGFFVNAATTPGGMVNFKNSQRVFQRESPGSSVFFRGTNTANSKPPSEGNNLIKRVRLDFVSSEGATRPLLLAFVPDNKATDGFDYGYDAKFYDDNSPSYMVWTIGEGKYVIQGVGDFEKANQYPVAINLATSGNIEIALTALENFDHHENVYVYDALLDTYTKINNSRFKMVLDAGEYLNRFYITFTKAQNKLLDIIDVELENTIVNYLNNSNEIYIRVPEGINVKQVYLINIIGQTVRSWNVTNMPNISGNEFRIPVKNISGATYIVKVETNSSTVNKKIIITY